MASCLYVTLVTMTQVSVSDKPQIISGLGFEPFSALIGALVLLILVSPIILFIIRRNRGKTADSFHVTQTGMYEHCKENEKENYLILLIIELVKEIS